MIKVFITWPVFFWFSIKLWSKTRKKQKKKTKKEESLYRWTKRYSNYLLWLEGWKINIKNKDIWNEKANFIVCDKINPFLLLALMKINKFEENAPLSFLINEEEWKKLGTKLNKFYSLINNFIIKKNQIKQNINLCIENIKIPRNFFVFSKVKKENWEEIINIPYGGFSQILFISTSINQKKMEIQFQELITPMQILKLNKKFLIQKIQKWSSLI